MSPDAGRVGDPYAVLRPRRGRAVAIGIAVASLVVFGGLALVLPATGDWSAVDSALLAGFGLLLVAMMWRFATLRADPSPSGLVVRNVLVTTTVRWAQIERVRFGGGDPWVLLDLDDGVELAVMAVQKADGEHGRREAGRLAALVQAGRERQA
ncbi:PH domain-containing protein [Angustibacter aerolatus]